MDPIIREMVNHRDVGDDYLAVLRHVIVQLGDGYATFTSGISRARRRELIRQVFACHREHRARCRHGMARRSTSSPSVGLPGEAFAASRI